MERLIKAIKAFFAVLGGSDAEPAKQEPASAPSAAVKEPAAAKASDFEAGAVYTLSLLQREGRLVDFLQEDLSSCSDIQLGAAARQIHENCAKVLKERFGVAPVAAGSVEGAPFTLPGDFDPCEFKLTGNVPEGGSVAGGTLVHKGWRAAKVDLPTRTGRVKPEVICQAEVGF